MCKEKIKKAQSIDKYITNKQLIKLVNSFFNIPKIEIENKEGNKNPISFKIITLGNSGVGKTSIFYRLAKDEFKENYQPTIGVYLSDPYYIKYKKQKYKLFLYDTGGQEKNITMIRGEEELSNITPNYLKLSDGVIFVYDVSDKESFYKLEFWYNLYKKEKEKINGLLIGNKCDCERKVNYDEGKKFAIEHGLAYMETSAKLDKGVKKAFAYLLEIILESQALYNSIDSLKTNDKIELNAKELKKESFCQKFLKKLNPRNWFKKKQ